MLLDTIELARGSAVIRYVKSYTSFTDSNNMLLFSSLEFEVSEPDFAVSSVPQMTVTIPNTNDSVRNWIELAIGGTEAVIVNDSVRNWTEIYANTDSTMITFRRYQAQVIVKKIAFPVINISINANSITLLAEPVNISDLSLHKLMYTTTIFQGLAT